MSLSDPFSDVKPVIVNKAVPGGTCDGLLVTADGNLSYTTMKGTTIPAYAVVAGQIVPVRVSKIETGTTATVLAGYHN